MLFSSGIIFIIPDYLPAGRQEQIIKCTLSDLNNSLCSQFVEEVFNELT
jgi:hypothetical protein